MLNSIGLANIGVHKFIEEKLPALALHACAIIANIAASTVEEYCNVLELLDPYERVNGFEINVSCPNVKEGGLVYGTTRQKWRSSRENCGNGPKTAHRQAYSQCHSYFRVCASRRSRRRRCRFCHEYHYWNGGKYSHKKPRLSTVTGGLSGPAIKPVALAKVFEVYKYSQDSNLRNRRDSDLGRCGRIFPRWSERGTGRDSNLCQSFHGG